MLFNEAMNNASLLGRNCKGRTCPYGCCSEKSNHNHKDRKANKRAIKRAERAAWRKDVGQ